LLEWTVPPMNGPLTPQEDTKHPDVDILHHSGNISSENGEQAPPVFAHPRSYINEDGELAIWVGRPPGYEFLDDEMVSATTSVAHTGTGEPVVTQQAQRGGDNRAARRAGPKGPKVHPKTLLGPKGDGPRAGRTNKGHPRGR
jgi:hypothetical protein